jgi:hypothetical protein
MSVHRSSWLATLRLRSLALRGARLAAGGVAVVLASLTTASFLRGPAPRKHY